MAILSLQVPEHQKRITAERMEAPVTFHVSSLRNVSHAITNISRPSLPRLGRRSRNGAVIGQSCISPVHPTPPPSCVKIPSSQRRSRDGAMIGQYCLHIPAKIVVERQSQLTGPSYKRSNQGKSRESLMGGPSCLSAMDPRAALHSQTHSSSTPLMGFR
jgi:hypothetical protein